MIIYTRLLWFAAGFAPLPNVILIHPKYRNDLPLHVHEKVHQEQMRRVGLIAFWWRYLTDKDFRQACEVEGYKVQVARGADLNACARNLATKYRLNLTIEQALKLLEQI